MSLRRTDTVVFLALSVLVLPSILVLLDHWVFGKSWGASIESLVLAVVVALLVLGVAVWRRRR
jgi:hypothetical protein